MSFAEDLETLPEALVPAEFGRFRQHINPLWIEEALLATGTASVRRRRLPAEQVVWVVLGMALLRNESIERVIETLVINDNYFCRTATTRFAGRSRTDGA